jgi:uncharacterized protein YjiS (DUF1127 family)
MRPDVLDRPDISSRSSLFRLVTRFEKLLERRRSRLALLELSDDMLKDIGVSRCEAYREATRPFWN